MFSLSKYPFLTSNLLVVSALIFVFTSGYSERRYLDSYLSKGKLLNENLE